MVMATKSIEDCFEVPEKERAHFIENSILKHVSKEDWGAVRWRAARIAKAYVGQDVNALSVLAYAAEQGKFDEFAGKLEGYHDRDLAYVHPEARRNAQVAGAVRAEDFFLECYKTLGVPPVRV